MNIIRTFIKWAFSFYIYTYIVKLVPQISCVCLAGYTFSVFWFAWIFIFYSVFSFPPTYSIVYFRYLGIKNVKRAYKFCGLILSFDMHICLWCFIFKRLIFLIWHVMRFSEIDTQTWPKIICIGNGYAN